MSAWVVQALPNNRLKLSLSNGLSLSFLITAGEIFFFNLKFDFSVLSRKL